MSQKVRKAGSGRAPKAESNGSSIGNGKSANGNGAQDPLERSDRSDRMELPMLSLPSAHPCHGCGECCRYIAAEIDAPTCNGDYEHIFWYLAHKKVAVYMDWEGDWFLEFETTCEHLTEATTCGIYEERPRICSEFSWETCEQNMPEPAAKVRFETPQQFFDWLEEKRPKAFERYTKFRRKLLAGRKNSASRVTVRDHPALAG